MANALDKDIEGSVVVLKEESLKDKYSPLPERIVEVKGGFGASSVTTGTALLVEFYIDGEEARLEGWYVDRELTEDAEAFDFMQYCESQGLDPQLRRDKEAL
jgi:hypothetical protein